jgi:hypothetical protein
MNTPLTFEFRWLSPLGISVLLFLGFGVLHALAGIVVPVMSRVTGKTGGLSQTRVDLLMVLVLAFGIIQLGVSWFALREGKQWGLWMLAAMDLAELIA